MEVDAKKKELIERFACAVSCHGPGLAHVTALAQVTEDGGLFDFLSPSCSNIGAASFYRNKLQTNSKGSWSSLPQNTPYGVCHRDRGVNALSPSSSKEQEQSSEINKSSQFRSEVQQFIAAKADVIFQMRGHELTRREAEFGDDASYTVLAKYSETPPLESFMEIPAHIKKQELFKVLNIGDIVVGEVVSKRPFGIFLKLRNLEFGVNRDLSDVDVQALCRTSELDVVCGSREFHDPVDAFVVGDLVRGVICGISIEEQRVSVSLRPSKVPLEHSSVKLGVIEDPELLMKRATRKDESTCFNDYLREHVGFTNPQNVETLVNMLGINTVAPCSLLRSMQRCDYPAEDYFDALRKKQSAKWSMETTAKGVEHFKAGEHDIAVRYLGHALQIDPENIEARVARGALSANKGEFEPACEDFRQALSLNASHRNARKYLVETLTERGKMLEKEGRMLDAVHCFKEVNELDSYHTVAIENLERIQQYLASERQRKESASKIDSKGDVKSRFSHVRQLIKEDPSLERKKKKKDKKKRKKKAKSTKKRRSKTHRSKRSSSTESCSSHGSASCSSSESEWVEKPRTESSQLGKAKSSFGHQETRNLSEEERNSQLFRKESQRMVHHNTALRLESTSGFSKANAPEASEEAMKGSEKRDHFQSSSLRDDRQYIQGHDPQIMDKTSGQTTNCGDLPVSAEKKSSQRESRSRSNSRENRGLGTKGYRSRTRSRSREGRGPRFSDGNPGRSVRLSRGSSRSSSWSSSSSNCDRKTDTTRTRKREILIEENARSRSRDRKNEKSSRSFGSRGHSRSRSRSRSLPRKSRSKRNHRRSRSKNRSRSQSRYRRRSLERREVGNQSRSRSSKERGYNSQTRR